MMFHADSYANWHISSPVPNDTLPKDAQNLISTIMAEFFGDALKWHMEAEQTSIAQLCRASGVSRDVINKLLARPKSSTSAENALLIASYYGKSVNQFVNLETVGRDDQMQTLLQLLSPKERQLVAEQIKGVLAARSLQSK